jgi:hypothetical protein
MSLPASHRKALNNWRQWKRQGGPTFLGVQLRTSRRAFVIAATSAAVLAFFAYTGNLEALIGSALLFGGVFFGFLAGDLGVTRQFVRFWPTLEQVVDWDRVDQLLGVSDHSSSSGDEHGQA